jgi:hypothetical protein
MVNPRFRPWPIFMLLLAAMLTLVNSSIPVDAAMNYHGNTNTRKFHDPSCRYYDCPHCTAVFTSREAAINAGYVPCKVCNP